MIVLCVVSCDFDLGRSEEHTSEIQSRSDLVCRLLLEKKKEQIRDFVMLGNRVNGSAWLYDRFGCPFNSVASRSMFSGAIYNPCPTCRARLESIDLHLC